MKFEYTCQERSVYAGKALWPFPTGAAIYDRRSYSLLCIDHAPEKPIQLYFQRQNLRSREERKDAYVRHAD